MLLALARRAYVTARRQAAFVPCPYNGRRAYRALLTLRAAHLRANARVAA